MLAGRETVAFVWRCRECSEVYDVEGLMFLYSDDERRYCRCGGRLVEGVEPAEAHRWRLVIPERFEGTRLHRELVRREEGEDVEIAVGGGGGRISIFCEV